MIVTGRYEKDDNFTTVYSDNTIYTIAKNGSCGSVKVGERTYMGNVLTQEEYDCWNREADRVGTFEIED